MSLNPFLPRPGRPSAIHYAWIVLFSGVTLSALTSGVRMSFGVFIDPLVEQYGWSRGSISLAYSLLFLASVPVAVGVGRLADTFGARRLVLASTPVFGTGMMLTGMMTQLWQFYLYFGMIFGVGSTVLMVVLPVLVTRWFHRMGLAMGLMWTSVGVGPMVFSPLFRWLISVVGWEQAFYTIGLGATGIMLLATFFLRNHPGELGITAYGEPAATPGAVRAATTPAAPQVSLSLVRATSAFWLLITVHWVGCVGHSIPLAHMVSMATFVGVPGVMAAGLLSATSGASLVSRFGMSMLTERLGGKRILSLTFVLQAAPMLLLLGAKEPQTFYIFALIFGLGFGGEMVTFPILNRLYYGSNAPLNTIYAYEMAGALLGMALGGWLGGFLFDLTGNYTWSILASAAFSFAGLIPILLLPTPGRLSHSPHPPPPRTGKS